MAGERVFSGFTLSDGLGGAAWVVIVCADLHRVLCILQKEGNAVVLRVFPCALQGLDVGLDVF